MITGATVFTVGNTMIVAGVILAIVLLLRVALRGGQTRPEARLGGGISGFERRQMPRVPEPPPIRAEERARRRRRGGDEPTTVLRPESATTARWTAGGEPTHEPPTTWDDSTGERWDAGGEERPGGSDRNRPR